MRVVPTYVPAAAFLVVEIWVNKESLQDRYAVDEIPKVCELLDGFCEEVRR